MSQQKEKGSPSSPSAFKEFCSTTSAHGYGHLTKGTIFLRTCWGFLLAVAFCLTIGHLYALTSKYLKYDYYDVISMKPDIVRRFPDVTICDTVGISDHTVSRYKGTKAMLKHLHISREYIKSWVENEKVKDSYGESFLTNILNNALGFEYIFANLQPHERSLIGTVFDSLVVSCKYADQSCGVENFELYENPEYINCFTFKPQTVNAKYNNLLGPEFGLSLILRGEPTLDKSYYAASNTLNTNSIDLHIHPANTMPFLSSYGLHIVPGKSTSIELNQMEFQRLESPYSDCHPDTFINVNSKRYIMEPRYCLRQCMRDAMFKSCNCVSTLLGDAAEDHTGHCMYLDTRNISNLNISRMVCEIETLLSWERNETLECQRCVWNCRETKYDTKISHAEWPQAGAVEDFVYKYIISAPRDNPIREYYDHLGEVLGFNCSENSGSKIKKHSGRSLKDITEMLATEPQMFAEDSVLMNLSWSPHVPKSLLKSDTLEDLHQKWIKESFYRLNIYFSEPFVTCHNQIPSFSFEDFCSGIGGVLGLWAGASVLTILELFSFCGHLIFKKSVR